MSLKNLKPVFQALIAYKCIFFAFIGAAICLLPPLFHLGFYNLNFPLEHVDEVRWSDFFSTWDARSYLRLAQVGYEPGIPTAAYYPLWPLMIHTFDWILPGDQVLAALILSNALSLVALCLLYKLIVRTHGDTIAGRSLILLLAFPGAFFFSFPYTESAFLLLIVSFFLFLENKNYRSAALISIFAPLLKPLGVLLVLPLGYAIIKDSKSKRTLLYCTLPVFGFGLYFLSMWAFTGDALSGMKAQGHFRSQASFAKIFSPMEFVHGFSNAHKFHGITDSYIDRIFFICFLLCIPRMCKLNFSYALYAVPFGIVPALTQSFMSYTRYVAILFPVFMVITQYLEAKRSLKLFWSLVGVFAGLQVIFVLRHINAYWAG